LKQPRARRSRRVPRRARSVLSKPARNSTVSWRTGSSAVYATLVATQNPYEVDLWKDHLHTGVLRLLVAAQGFRRFAFCRPRWLRRATASYREWLSASTRAEPMSVPIPPSEGHLRRQGGVRKFFENILRNLDVAECHLEEFVTEYETVVVFGFESGTVKASGSQFRNQWAQKYVVRNGLITEMEEYKIQVSATE
jgi:ketosteroid isomerase-like protein